MRKNRCCAFAARPAKPKAPTPAPSANASRRVIVIMRPSSQGLIFLLACTRKRRAVHRSQKLRRARRTWANVFRSSMPRHQSIDVGAMISGIQRWVETESPTSDRAAVNRMVDLVQSDVAGLPVAVERVAGKDRYADNLIVRNQAAGGGAGILILSHIDTVH